MAETKAQKWGQMEVTSVEKFLPIRAPDQCHGATENRLPLVPLPISLDQLCPMETEAGMQ